MAWSHFHLKRTGMSLPMNASDSYFFGVCYCVSLDLTDSKIILHPKRDGANFDISRFDGSVGSWSVIFFQQNLVPPPHSSFYNVPLGIISNLTFAAIPGAFTIRLRIIFYTTFNSAKFIFAVFPHTIEANVVLGSKHILYSICLFLSPSLLFLDRD